MDCRDTRRLLNQFVDDELEADRSFEVDRHLEACPCCRKEADEIKALDVEVKEACCAGAAPAPDLRSRLEAALEGEIAREAAHERSRARVGWALRRVAAAVAMLLIPAALLTLSPGPASAAFVQDHDRCGGCKRPPGGEGEDPVVRDEKGLESLCHTTAGAHAKVVCLKMAGYELLGGAVCRVGKTDYLHLVYADGPERASVFVGRRWAGVGGYLAGERDDHEGGYEVVRVRCPGGTEYFVVAQDGLAPTLRNLVRQQVGG